MDHSKLFYVLNGLLNGQKGVLAIEAGGSPHDLPMADGHYYQLDDQADGHGPHESVEDAWSAYVTRMNTRVYAFPMEEGDAPYVIDEDQQTDPGIFADCNVATITRLKDTEGDYYTVKIEGSYEKLSLEMTAPGFEQVADVYAQLLRNASKYQ